MQIEDRISGMSDKELDNLHDNAVRLAKSGAAKQKAEAERLLPIIDAAIETRGVAAKEAQAAKKLQQRAARPRVKKKAAPVEVAEVDEEEETTEELR